MLKRVFLALMLISTLVGCGQENAAPSTTAGSASTASPAVAVSVTQTEVKASPELVSEVPDFKEDRKVYEQDQLKPLEATVTLFEKEGATLEDTDNDVDTTDSFEPRVDVLFQEGEFGKGIASGNATLKQRGHSTRKANQKSYQIKLSDKKQRWRNHRTIDLNKHPYDLTRFRNKLAFELFKTLPHMGSLRTQFVHLKVKKNAADPGKDFGLFTQVEHCNENFLANHGLDPEGNLYSAEDFVFARSPKQLMLASDTNYKKEKFEKVLEIRASSDHEKLLAMLDDVNNSAMDIDLVIKKHFNLNNYLTWFAMNILLENMDTVNQNFTLYSPKKGTGWYFLPWDYDGALGFLSQPNELKKGEWQHFRFQQGVSNWWESKLHRRFLSVPKNLKALLAKLEELKKNEFSQEKIKGLVQQLMSEVKPFVSRLPDLEFLPVANTSVSRASNAAGCVAEFEAECNRLSTVVEANHQAFLSTLERPMPFLLDEVLSEENGSKVAFTWELSTTLTGEPVTYDLLVSKTPDFEVKPLVFESLNLPAAQVAGTSTTTARLVVPAASLPSGQLFWRVVARSTKNPAENWQFPYQNYKDSDKTCAGMNPFEKPR